MPYDIEKRQNRYCVVKVSGGSKETVKCHNTRSDAQAHLTALNINVEDKTMPITKEELKAKFKELRNEVREQKFYGVPQNFDEWDALQESRKIMYKIWDYSDAFDEMFIDILYSTFEDGMVGNLNKMVELIDSFGGRIMKLRDELDPVIESVKAYTQEQDQEPQSTGLDFLKSALISALKDTGLVPKKSSIPSIEHKELSDNLSIIKGTDGKQYLYGRPTNNVYDREGEVLTEESHKEFMAYLDDNPNEAPELWAWHVPGTAFKNRAVWWDYADGFVHMLWPLEDSEAKNITKVFKNYKPGMSHGFRALKRDGDSYLKYRSFEASLLPLEYAANLYTTFELIGEVDKMFTPTKRGFIEKLSGEEVANDLEAKSEQAKAVIDAKGGKRKDVDDEPETVSQESEVPEDVEEEEPDEIDDTQPEVDPVKEMTAHVAQMEVIISKGMSDMLDVVKGLEERLKIVEDKLTKQPEPEAPKVEGKSLAAVVEGINLFSGSVFDRPPQTKDTDEPIPQYITDSISEPKATDVDVGSQHILSGMLPKVAANGTI